MTTDSMTDQNFHEIQLSGKQLVFAFMSLVVVAVVIFLLGVSVGRGVRNAVPAGTDVSAAPAPAGTAPAAGARQAGPGDLTYHDVLQGKQPAPPGAGVQPPPPAPAVAAPPVVTAPPTPAPPAPADTKAAGSTKGPDAAKGPDSSKGADSTKAVDSKAGARAALPTAASGWFVQVNTFSTLENAEKQVQQLKAKSFTAFVYTPVGPVPRFHVRLGPYAQRPEAERMAARLVKEGFTPLIAR